MNDEPIVIVDQSHPKCTLLILNRPNKRNALTIELMHELTRLILEAEKMEDQRAIIIKGNGPVFCAGLDLRQTTDKKLEEASAEAMKTLLFTLNNSKLVTIAAVHGAALAGGLGLVAACNLCVAESGAIFGLPEVRRGLVAALVMPYLARIVPERFLLELLLTAETIKAPRAYEIGLINLVSKTFSSLADSLHLASLISKGGVEAVSLTRSLLKNIKNADLEKVFNHCLDVHRQVRVSDEAEEGMRAFLEKRLPSWDK